MPPGWWCLRLQSGAREYPITVLGVSRLLLPAEHELRGQNGRQRHWSLRCLALGFANPAANPSATDFDSVFLEQNVSPLQPECLTDPQTSGGDEQRERPLRLRQVHQNCERLLRSHNQRFVIAGGVASDKFQRILLVSRGINLCRCPCWYTLDIVL